MWASASVCSLPAASITLTSKIVVPGAGAATPGDSRKRACSGTATWNTSVAGVGA